jgi:CheY-like chemotaxis protein
MKRAADAGEPFALVLLDAMMPGTDGFQLAERIKNHPDLTGAVLMMLSSAGQPGDAARCRAMGIVSYLTKPIKQAELLSAILSARHGAAATTTDETNVLSSAPVAPRGLRLLLVEDNLVNQRLAVGLLEKQGHTVVVAENGKEALEVLEKAADSFDLVLMDLAMPILDGFEATTAIRQREKATGKHLPIVAMTAHALKGDRERCLEAGMDDYVSKPIRASELFEAIRRQTASGSPPQVVEDELLRRVQGNRQLMAEVMRIYLATWRGMLSDLRRAVETSDTAAARLAAHSLRGAVVNFGRGQAFETASRLEEMARTQQLTEAGPLLTELEEALLRMEPELRALLESSASS